MGEAGCERYDAPIVKQRADRFYIWQMIAANFRQIEEPDVARAQSLARHPPEKRFHGIAQYAQMYRHVMTLGDQFAVSIHDCR